MCIYMFTYICVSFERVCVCVCVFPFSSVSNETKARNVLIFKHHFPLKEISAPWKKVWGRKNTKGQWYCAKKQKSASTTKGTYP